MAKNFYEELEGFSDFRELAEERHFTQPPADWYLVLTDVRGSTRAIREGRYRDVNTLGAASVAVVQEELRPTQFPFVFGGDGATFLVPPQNIESVKVALQKLMTLSKRSFSFELRVGVMTVAAVEEAGQKIRVAKFNLNPETSIAFIKGGGLAWAEKKVKEENSKFCLQELTSESWTVPRQLSCRWQPIKAKKGQILTMLIQSRVNDLKVISRLALEVEAILGGRLHESNPAKADGLRYKGLFQLLRDEKRVRIKISPKEVLEITLAWWAYRLGLPAPFAAAEYKTAIASHSDHLKFDEILRMVLDCSKSDAAKINDLLKTYFENGEIFFGIHESSHALMTCLVENLGIGGHVHFIDGSDGGYAMAATELKKQINSYMQPLGLK